MGDQFPFGVSPWTLFDILQDQAGRWFRGEHGKTPNCGTPAQTGCQTPSLPYGLCELHQSTWDSLPLQPLPQFSHLRIGPLPSTVVWALITGVPVSWALVVTVQRHNTGLHQGEDFNTYRYTLEPFGGFFAAGNRAVFDPCLVAGAAMVDCHSSDWHFSSWRVS